MKKQLKNKDIIPLLEYSVKRVVPWARYIGLTPFAKNSFFIRVIDGSILPEIG